MKIVIILAMHGMPPNDFPQKETLDYFMLHSRIENMPGPPPSVMQQQYEELDKKMRNWPRTQENDSYYHASNELAEGISKQTGYKVIVGFNEFCSPSLDEAFVAASKDGSEKIIVITPMMTRGGEHSEKDIPEAIERTRKKFPNIQFSYVWPFNISKVAAFLAEQIRDHY
ncbi:MAG TPA: CbiX/SirB N-terminal domain-containing protein [Candidatus Nanopelagicaceae bacterium]|nr:CbiX/SirB N-terminal domain-containing protein [Candidatus Nanopelagicaceae bacterium]